MQPQSFYWYDYETFGNRPDRDWPAQFAGIRTDADFNEIEPPLEIFCRLPLDSLPQPKAVLITGLTPQYVNEKGVCEAEFIQQINQKFSYPGTCVTGYNNLKFDDEITRYSLYRNFLDPYAREYKNGNSRWDLIDMVRLCAALRPEGINWPLKDDGAISFRLEDLTKANAIEHGQAHNAVSDVRATIELAKLIKTKQPKLFNYVIGNKDKKSAAALLDLTQKKAVIHISSRYPARQRCMAIVMPLAMHPVNQNEVIVYDLKADPLQWMHLSEEEIAANIFSSRQMLDELGRERIPLKTVRLNRCPVLAPLSALRPEDAERLQVDQSLLKKHYQMLADEKGLSQKLQNVFGMKTYEAIEDPDRMLYSGGFFSNKDRQLMQKIHNTPAEALHALKLPFEDNRLDKMLFRYRARNWPDTLSENDNKRWKSFCFKKLMDIKTESSQENNADGMTEMACFKQSIEQGLSNIEYNEKQKQLLHDLFEYGDIVTGKLGGG